MASLADAYKPNRRAGMEHSPRPMNPWPAVDRAAASLAQYIPSPAQGRRMSMDEEGNVYGSTAEENQLSSLVDFLAGTGAAPTALGRMEPGVLNALGGKVGGKPASVIKDWKWRPEAEVQADLGLTSIPEHVQDFGRFMEDMALKAKRGEMSPRDSNAGLELGIGRTQDLIKSQFRHSAFCGIHGQGIEDLAQQLDRHRDSFGIIGMVGVHDFAP